ncbi:MAG: hypothetical protein ACM336_04255 [Acidobacteriota bacterium]
MPSEHTDDALLESYALSRLQGPELESVERHLVDCERCRARLVATEAFQAAQRDARILAKK